MYALMIPIMFAVNAPVPQAAQPTEASVLAKLQGTWRGRYQIDEGVGIDMKLTMKITDANAAFTVDGKEISSFQLRLHPGDDPPGIDMIANETQGNRDNAFGIYRFEDGKLTICLSSSTDAGNRPREFVAKANRKPSDRHGDLMVIFERAK